MKLETDKPRDDNDPTQDREQNAGKQNDDTSGGRANPSLYEGPCPDTASYAQYKWYEPHYWRKRPLGWWKDRIEFVAFVFAIGYAVVTYCQWKDAHETFNQVQRPWIGFLDEKQADLVNIDSSVPNELGVTVVYHLVNYGALPAAVGVSGILVETDQAHNVGDVPNAEPRARANCPSAEKELANPRETILPKTSSRYGFGFDGGTGNTIIPEGPRVILSPENSNNHFLVNFGCIAYRETAKGEVHYTVFKAYFNWPGNDTDALPFAGLWVIGEAN
jgi:hypothetical protein